MEEGKHVGFECGPVVALEYQRWSELDEQPSLLDFHSLRHTCGAWMAMANVRCKTVQTVMRHSTITLTMDTYGHLFPGQEAEAVGKLPEMFRRRAEGEGGNAA